ncbi:elongation of very long chain fatty acids protein AAEL008004-like [Cylas formicarius]|uniref:elongation of very long chain fatty acids protein AAEL008004-like n=1 Tax=Cylas formicarius TaxID=197179 RepID=UPI002958882B|nr:elongation of very long chain fatty acids protein AAEL008004-like [Cylas formicarius]
MTTVLQYVYDFVDEKSDPRVRNWTFMENFWPTLTIIALYLLSVYVFLPTYMKNRKPYKLKAVIRVYNLFQIVACVVLIYLTLNSGWVQGRLSLGCQPVDYSNDKYAVQLLNVFHWTYFLKVIELIETVFFVLRKKYNQVSPLHVYHHASTMTLAWIACKFVGGGMASFPIIINSSIHVMMYTYYYLASLGTEWQKALVPWKPRMTVAQMVQFCILILHSLLALLPSCNVPKSFLLLYLPNIVLLFKMFYDFYHQSYTKNHIQKIKQ